MNETYCIKISLNRKLFDTNFIYLKFISNNFAPLFFYYKKKINNMLFHCMISFKNIKNVIIFRKKKSKILINIFLSENSVIIKNK
jgi:hypothetical protein